MRRRTKNTSKKSKIYISKTHKPSNPKPMNPEFSPSPIMAPYCHPLWPSTDHWRMQSSQSLRWSNRSPSPLSTRIFVKCSVSPISLLDSLFSRKPLKLAPDPTPHNETKSSINIDDDKESSYSSPSYWFTRSWPSIFSLAIANLWEKINKISRKFRIKSQSKIKQRERKREQKWEFFCQNWSGEAMEEKEKEILDPRKVFSLFFPFSKKVEWSQESMGVFTLMALW